MAFARDVLEERLAQLENEVPKYVFATKISEEYIIRTENGSDILCRPLPQCVSKFHSLSHLLFCFVAAFLEPEKIGELNYQGITLCNPLHHGSGYIVEGRYFSMPRDENEELTVSEGLRRLYFRYRDENGSAERAQKIFNKYESFLNSHRIKSRRVKPFYDLSRHIKSHLGLQKPNKSKPARS